MSFWSENYSFIKDVYDTRVSKMIEWMDHVEMAIQKVITKVHAGNYGNRRMDRRYTIDSVYHRHFNEMNGDVR